MVDPWDVFRFLIWKLKNYRGQLVFNLQEEEFFFGIQHQFDDLVNLKMTKF